MQTLEESPITMPMCTVLCVAGRRGETMEAAIWGFLGTIVGAAASIATSWMAFRSESHRHQQTDAFDRVERARAFQRDNLLELQDSIQDMMRCLGQMWQIDERAARESGVWAKVFLPEDLNEAQRATNARVLALTERVADDALRVQLKDLRGLVNDYVVAKSQNDASKKMLDASRAYDPVMERIGALVRTLY